MFSSPENPFSFTDIKIFALGAGGHNLIELTLSWKKAALQWKLSFKTLTCTQYHDMVYTQVAPRVKNAR